MKRNSYSFDLNILDNTQDVKENSIKISDCHWSLVFLLSNTFFQIIFTYEFQLVFNLIIFATSSYLFYMLYYFEEKDLYEDKKFELIGKIITYLFYLLWLSYVFIKISLIMNHNELLRFNSPDLGEKYFSVLIVFFSATRGFSLYFYKKYVKEKFPFYKFDIQESNNEKINYVNINNNNCNSADNNLYQ